MEYDIIDGLASEALVALNNDAKDKAFNLLCEIKVQAKVLQNQISLWEQIQEDYESGAAPRKLAQKYATYGIKPRDISDRAHYYNWVSPRKLKKAMKPAAGKKNIFYPNCRSCEQPFEAYSGHAIICGQCKAYKAKEQARKKVEQ
jgi:hypothetical protein